MLRPALAALLVTLAATPALAATLQVGPGKPFARPCDAASVAKDGDTIEIDAAGKYDGDVCQWHQNGLTLRGVNGRPRIDATGVTIPNGKGIWVFYGDTTTVENVELSGASVPDQNGAGIRHQGLNLTVRGCYIHDNQDGILGGPLANGQPADGQGEVLIETTELARNGAGDGLSHNLYLNHYAKLTLRYSWSHSSKVGHLVKSRALQTFILNNRLSDEESIDVSYEINLPNGGQGFIVGNLVEQASDPAGLQNGAIIDFGSEGPITGSALFVVNNTVLNNRKAGTFVKVNGGVGAPSLLRNNIFAGAGTVCDQASAVLDHNLSGVDPLLADPANLDFHLLPGSPAVDQGVDPGEGGGLALAPLYQYVHPASFEPRKSVGPIDIGAYELGGGGGAGGGGAGGGTSSGSTGSSSSGGTTSGGTTGGGVGAGGTGGTAPAAGGSGGQDGGTAGGCGCRAAGEGEGTLPALVAAMALGLVCRRRRGSAP